jgi:hypothetical protein
MTDAEKPKLIYPVVVGEDFAPHWAENLAEVDYHADKTAISSSSLKYMLKSPRSFHRRFVEGKGKKETPSMRLGRAAHMFALEPDRFRRTHVVMPDFGDLRSSKNRAARDGWTLDQPPGAMIVSGPEMDKLLLMIERLLAHPIAHNLIVGAVFEASGYFRDPVTGLKCRIKPDILRTDLSAMPDLKTTVDASREAFSRTIWRYRYDVQLAFYSLGVSQICGRPPRHPCFIAIESTDDHDVCVYEADEGMMERGQRSMRIALNRIARCLETQRWPGLQDDVGGQYISLPTFTDWVEEGGGDDELQ